MTESVNMLQTNEETFSSVSGDTLLSMINTTLKTNGHCVVGLSGGGTPKPIYEWLGQQQADWDRITFFIVDERYIPATETTSNTNMIRQTLTKGNQITETQIICPDTSLPLQECITHYQDTLKELFDTKGNENQSSHVIVLGMGGDGHIASLFPDLSPELLPGKLPKETIFHTETTKFDVKDRITISLEQIASASNKLFFLKGAEKENVWNDMSNDSSSNITRWPALYVTQSRNTTAVCCFPLQKSTL